MASVSPSALIAAFTGVAAMTVVRCPVDRFHRKTGPPLLTSVSVASPGPNAKQAPRGTPVVWNALRRLCAATSKR